MVSIVRGFLARRKYARLFDEMLHVLIRVPATKCAQRVYRGHVGRLRAARKRLERACAIEIQRHVRGFVKRCWLVRVKLWKKKHAAATLLSHCCISIAGSGSSLAATVRPSMHAA